MPSSIDNAKNRDDADRLLDRANDRFEPPDKMPANTDLNNTEVLLMRICKLLETRVRSAEEEREKAAIEDEMKKDWMLAAAVIDRLLFLTFTLIFITGTFIFFLAFSLSP